MGRIIDAIIKFWKAETPKDAVFCDDHEWVGSRLDGDECPECEAMWDGFLLGMEPMQFDKSEGRLKRLLREGTQ